MSDLISTQESVAKIIDTAIRKIISGEQKLTKEYEQSVIDAVDVILNTARRTAQPDIIRCKDCKYNTTSKKCLNPNSFFLVPSDDDFCSFAEKREV